MKYAVFLHDLTNGFAAERVIGDWIDFYNTVWPHSALADSTSAEACRAEQLGWDVLSFSALDRNADLFQTMIDALGTAGLVPRPYFQFGNYYETIRDTSYDEYVRRLPSGIRRLDRKFRQANDLRFVLTTNGEDLESAIDDYEKVYSVCWKDPENNPTFIPNFVRVCAASGSLRLGNMYVNGEPAATQIWVVHDGEATIYKLAYDEKFKKIGVGSMLSLQMMRHVIERDHVDEVDYGSGDDAYKKNWMSHRRERWGIVAYNPFSVRGAYCLAKNYGRELASRLLERKREPVEGRRER